MVTFDDACTTFDSPVVFDGTLTFTLTASGTVSGSLTGTFVLSFTLTLG